jgi:heat-inducible transcriptional repressor
MGILGLLVENYLATGQAVSSRTVSTTLAQRESDQVSSATIRNIFSRLEDEGLLYQPHTSAGRLPTLEGLRVYVRKFQQELSGDLDPAEEEKLRRALAGVRDELEMLARGCEFLSNITNQVGVVAMAPVGDTALRSIRFIRLVGKRVLALMMTADNEVRERVCVLPEELSQEELEAAARYFNQSFSGWSIERIRRELVRRLSEDRAAYDELLKRVVVLYHCGVLEMKTDAQVVVEGTAHLVDLMQSHERLRDILNALSQKQRLLALLGSLNEDAVQVGREGDVNISVGLDKDDLFDVSLVSTNYGAGSRQGTIGILGSTRMEYERAVWAVTRVREAFNRIIKEH